MKKTLSLLALVSMTTLASAATGPLENYFASVIPSNKVKATFDSMRTSTKSRSQCYNRAYVWSYELAKVNKVHSKKILIYYTNKYRKLLNPDWGFHISPVVTVDPTNKVSSIPYPLETSSTSMDLIGKRFGVEGQAIKEREAFSLGTEELNMVMDREFTNSPTTVSEWVDIFIKRGEQKLEVMRRELLTEINTLESEFSSLSRSGRQDRLESIRSKLTKAEEKFKMLGLSKTQKADISCEMIEHISPFDEANAQGEDAKDWCYVQLISQYYWNPVDLRNLNYENQTITSFNKGFLTAAKKEAFTDWRTIGLDLKSANSRLQKEMDRIDATFDHELFLINESFNKQMLSLESLSDKQALELKHLEQVEALELNRSISLSQVQE